MSSDPPVDPEALGLHEIIQVPDVPFDDSGFVRKRSLSKRALLLEADSSLHQAAHFPHNPLCEICGLSHMRAASFHRSVPADRSDQFAPTGPNQMYSADTLIISRSKVFSDPTVPIPAKVSGEGHSNSFGIRDCYSGCGFMFPQLVRTTLGNIHASKHFHGPMWQADIHVIVKSDSAPDIQSAITELRWLPDLSLTGGHITPSMSGGGDS